LVNVLETLIESFIRDGIVTEEELEQRIAEERENSPMNDLANIAKVEVFQIQMVDQLGKMLNSSMAKNIELEQRVHELEAKVND
jgi:BMFP domain-containing protein YqiC